MEDQEVLNESVMDDAGEQLSTNPEDYDVDSTDVSPEALSELLGESEEQSEKGNSKKELDHDKSTLGESDLDEIQDLLSDNEENTEGEESTEDSNDPKDGDAPESDSEVAEVEYNGKSYKVPAELKNAVMMQADYTKKTQEIAELRKNNDEFQAQLNEERETFRSQQDEFIQQNEKTLSEHQAFSYAADLIKQSDPDFYEEMQEKIQDSLRHYSNPVMDGLKKELTELKSKLIEREDSQTMGKFFTDWGQAQGTVIPKMEKLGIKVDQEKVKNLWGKGLSVKQSLNALYASDLMKVRESKAKVQAAKNAAARGSKPALKGAARKPGTQRTFSSYGDISASLLG